jgi:hypothetical protein
MTNTTKRLMIKGLKWLVTFFSRFTGLEIRQSRLGKHFQRLSWLKLIDFGDLIDYILDLPD